MDHRHFISTVGCLKEGLSGRCFLTIKNFLESSSMIPSSSLPKSSSSSSSSFQNLMLLSSAALVVFITLRRTPSIKGDDDGNSRSKKKAIDSNSNDSSNKNKLGLGVGISDARKSQIHVVDNDSKSHEHQHTLGLGSSDANISHVHVADNDSTGHEHQHTLGLGVGMSDANNSHIHVTDNDSESHEHQHTLGLGIGSSDAHNDSKGHEHQHTLGLGVGMSDAHNSHIHVADNDAHNSHIHVADNDSKSHEHQHTLGLGIGSSDANNDSKLGLGVGMSDAHNSHIHVADNDSTSDEHQHTLGLGIGSSDANSSLPKASISNIGRSRRQTIISKSVVGNKKENEKEKASPPLGDVSKQSPTKSSLDEDIRYEDIFAEKTLDLKTSPLRKSKDENEFGTPQSTPKASHPPPFPPESPYNEDDDRLTMLHVVSESWTLPIKINVEMNRDDALSYFSYHNNKIDNPKFKFECFTLTSPFSSWIIEKGLFEILTLEIKINSEFPNIRDEIIKKGSITLSRSSLEQFRSADLESSIHSFASIIGDYFSNIMSRKNVLRRRTTNAILIDFFDPPSFRRPRDPLKKHKKEKR